MLIPDCDVSRASALADRVMEELKKPVEVQGMDLNLTFCVGIAIAEGREHDAEAYVERAIAAMHKAKETGRSCYQFFSPEMNRIAQERMILGTALRHAMAQNSLHLVYQPQINLKTNELSGVEALCRWTDPVLGEIAPSRFIPLAEEINEIEAIARWTLREACRQMALWKQTGRQLPAISVNLSPVNFRDSKLQDYIQNLLHEYKLPPKQLTIEITENVMLDNPQSSVTVLHKLHDLGCGISLDDFGTGFSSLSRLARLPITELKLDRSFMRSFEEDPNSQAVALAVIRIGQSLGIEVVAEGVETEGQEKLLRHLGCDRLQGYLRGRLMTARELEDWLANQPQRGGLFVAAPHSGRPRHAT